MVKIPDLAASQALSYAKNGHRSLLVERLLAGISTPPELELIADIVKSAPKPFAHRPAFSPDKLDRDIAIYDFILDKLSAGKALKAAVADAVSIFELSKASIYEIFASCEAARYLPGPDN